MEGVVGHPPLTQSECPPPNNERFNLPPQQFKTDNPPPPYYNDNNYTQGPHPQKPPVRVVMVQQQPQAIIMTPAIRYVGDHYLTLGIVLTVLCVLIGTWFSLLCTIPAIIFSTMARDADAKGDAATATNHGRIALGLNIGAVVSWPIILGVALVIIIYG